MLSIRNVMTMAIAASMIAGVAVAQDTTPAADAATSAAAKMKKDQLENLHKIGDNITSNAAGMKKLELELPKPVFVGTPKNIKVPNLEPAGTKNPEVNIPSDAKNLAAGKEVSASDEEPIIGELEMITDGDKEAADGSYVEFGPGIQWVQVDLGEEANIYAIALWHYHQQAVVYNDVVVKVADDADFITNVSTVFNNDHDNSANLGVGKDNAYIETNEGKVIDTKGVKGRYVRLYTNGSTSGDTNHYIEVEVYGQPAK